MLTPPSADSRLRRRIASATKRLLVVAVGFTLLATGLLMLVLPGPGLLVIFFGLLVLATEYSWAGRAVERTRAKAAEATRRLHTTRSARAGAELSAAVLIVAGVAVVAYLEEHRYVGISLLIGGAGTLALLAPAAHRLIDPPTSSTASTPIPVRRGRPREIGR